MRNYMVLGAAALLLFVTSRAPAQQAERNEAAGDQFNLSCSGTEERTNALETPATTSQPFEAEFRVDLAAGRYCMNNCAATAPIYEITETRIEFSEPYERDRVRGTSALYVSRVSGKLSWYDYPPRAFIARSIEAHCDVTAFSGFPPVERQF